MDLASALPQSALVSLRFICVTLNEMCQPRRLSYRCGFETNLVSIFTCSLGVERAMLRAYRNVSKLRPGN